jgi:hypothetical protein
MTRYLSDVPFLWSLSSHSPMQEEDEGGDGDDDDDGGGSKQTDEKAEKVSYDWIYFCPVLQEPWSSSLQNPFSS